MSIVVTAHGEGRLLHRTLRCVAAGQQRASVAGLATELIVVADRATQQTIDYLERTPVPIANIVEVDFGFVGEARMSGVAAASGRYATIVDGDDLVSLNWITEAFLLLERSEPPTVAHPEYTVAFGASHMLVHHKDSDSDGFHQATLLERNPWTSTFAAECSTFRSIGFSAGVDGMGYEDWHFLVELLHLGGTVRTVGETTKFYRVKHSGSRFSEARTSGALLPRSSFFSPQHFSYPRQKAGGSLVSISKRRRGTAKSTLRIVRSGLDSRLPSLLPLAEGAYETAGLVTNRLTARRMLPKWVEENAAEIHAFEPEVTRTEVRRSRRYEANPTSRLGIIYSEMCAALRDTPTHILLVPWLRRGGADLEAINYAKVLGEVHGNRVAVIATHPDASSPWAEHLPDSMTFIPFGKLSRHLANDERRLLLASSMVQWSPKVIHNLNSREGWDVFVHHARPLATSRLYASVFCDDRSAYGQWVGYPFEHLPEVADQLSGLFADNERILRLLDTVYSLDPLYRAVHYHPAPATPQTERSFASHSLNVLWAGRLDRQRRPDLLFEVARASHEQGLPIAFHAYGSAMLDRRPHRFSRLPNLEYKGPFDSLSSIQVSDYQVFLNTSEWDGMPNILLEAATASLPVISSAVGGIPELIDHEKTGYLVDPFDDISEYLRGLRRALADPDAIESWAAAARELVRQRHSWGAFRASVESAPGYLT